LQTGAISINDRTILILFDCRYTYTSITASLMSDPVARGSIILSHICILFLRMKQVMSHCNVLAFSAY